jgi:hypothetical protein
MDSPEIDDAARGEDYTRGTSHVIWASLAAAVLVTAAVAIYVVAGQKPPAITGEVVQVWAHPMNSETSGVDANGAAMPKETIEQVLVLAQVRLHNQSKEPLFLHQIMANATLPDGIHHSYAAIPADYERVFVAYPVLAPLHGKSLAYDATIDPGQTQEGEFVSSFRLTRQQWDSRKDLTFTFAIKYQPNLVLTPTVPIIEQ